MGAAACAGTTGVAIAIAGVTAVLDRIRTDDDSRTRYHYVLIDFACRPTGGVAESASDADAIAWVPVSDLVQYGVAAATISVIQNAAARLASGAAGTWTPHEVDRQTE